MRTPNLDRLAGSGTRFANAYTPCPICIRARASLATGHHVHQIRYWDNGVPYDGRVRSWHHELRDHGRDEWPRHPAMEHFRWFFDFDRPFGEQKIRELVAAYDGAVAYLDRQIGRVLDVLHELGLADNTLVIYASDHGESTGARGLFGKFTMYEESAAVPLIVAGPGVDAGGVCDAPVSLVDIYPTVLHAAGMPADRVDGLMHDRPGRSLVATARNPDPDRVVFSEYHAVGSRRGYYMVRYRAWKYVHYVDAPAQLFDLETDPTELNDLATADPHHDSVQERLRSMLCSIVDPDATDQLARRDQTQVIDRHGGRNAVIRRGAFDNSPVPGEEPRFHL